MGSLRASSPVAIDEGGYVRQQLGSLREPALEQCVRAAPLVERVWALDPTLWPEVPHAPARLGWLAAAGRTRERAADLQALADAIVADGITDVLVLGMGGAVLSVAALAALVDRPRVRLHLLDSTHPDAVARQQAAVDPDTWLLLVASKSGTTIETRSLFDRFHADLVSARGDAHAGRHLVVLTDPGSPLVEVARARGARAVVATTERVSGRWSALDVLGMLPAVLLGVDVESYLAAAAPQLSLARSPDLADNAPARLGAILAAASMAGRHHLVLVLPEHLAGFGRWVAHLVGESLGKAGRGLVPIVEHHLEEPAQYGPDVLLVAMGEREGLRALADHGLPTVVFDEPTLATLGGAEFQWEFATAIAAALLAVDPFDAPAGAAAAQVTWDVLETTERLPAAIPAENLLDALDEVDRLVLSAWVDPGGAMLDEVRRAGAVLRRRFGIPVLVEVCPRALHVTAQLHNDGPTAGLHVAVREPPRATVDVPGQPWDFARLLDAALVAELRVLDRNGRRAGLVDLDDLLDA